MGVYSMGDRSGVNSQGNPYPATGKKTVKGVVIPAVVLMGLAVPAWSLFPVTSLIGANDATPLVWTAMIRGFGCLAILCLVAPRIKEFWRILREAVPRWPGPVAIVCGLLIIRTGIAISHSVSSRPAGVVQEAQ